jgi:hypothetical protein
MSSKRYEENYTKPDLRRQIKEDIKQSDKGGKPGQWSARKSQLLVQEYEKQGGGYKQDKKDDAAKSLEEWTDQNWQTMEGEGEARGDRITKRYLPKEVWNNLSNQEQREAEQTKEKGSKSGDQYVSWTPAIKRAMAEAGYSPDDDGDEDTEPTKQELYKEAQDLDVSGRSKMDKDELKEAVQAEKSQDDGGSSDSNSDNQPTKQDLYEEAQDLNVSGRSKMNKDELKEAVKEKKE